jgi:MFS family permease
VTRVERFLQFRQRHHAAFDVVFFLGGFAFDAFVLRRIDDRAVLIQQGAYLVVGTALFLVDHVLRTRGVEPAGRWGQVASMRVPVLHFFLGTLLNAFLVFYFRASASLFSFLFIAGLALAIIVNELPWFRREGSAMRLLLISFSVTSYLAYLIPVLWGQLERWHYFSAVGIGTVAAVTLWLVCTLWAPSSAWRPRRTLLPVFALQALLGLLYWAGVTPPVPLALQELAIYANVTPHRTDGGALHYTLEYQPGPRWRLWERENERFVAPAGSRVWAFTRVFAPSHFRDEVSFQWEREDPRAGWLPLGAPFVTELTGGNEQGFRTFSYLTVERPARYRVRVLTDDGREIGFKDFTYVPGELPESQLRED